MEELKFKQYPCEEDPRITILEIRGALDLSSIDPINEIVDKLIGENKFFLIADFESVEFVSSPAVGALMGCRRRLMEKGGNLVLVGMSNSLREKFTLMGANRIFQLYNDVGAVVSDYYWEYDAEPRKMQLAVPSSVAYVPAVRRLISTIVLQKGYSRKDAFRIETIVDELANNAVEHADEKQQKFYIEFLLDKSKVELVVKNSSQAVVGQKMDEVQEKFNNPVIDDESIRGRGLALVKMLSSELTLNIDEKGTSVRVTKVRED